MSNTPLTFSDPLATPLKDLQAPFDPPMPTQQLRADQPPVQMPMYQQLLQDAQGPAPEPRQMSEPPQEYPDDEMPEPMYPTQPPPQQQQYAYTRPPPPPPLPPQPAPEKPGVFSPQANKTLLILATITALVLQFAAPRLRAYPRFSSNAGLGLSIVGVVAVSIIIAVVFKGVTYAAGLS